MFQICPFQVHSAATHSGPYYAVEPVSVTKGPASVVNTTFTVTVKLYNVTAGNVPAGVDGIEIHLTWNSTLIQPVSYLDKLGTTGGVLNPMVLYGVNPGFYNSSSKPRVSVPPEQAKYYLVAGVSVVPWWGNGTIVEITFKVVSQPEEPDPAESCALELVFTDLVDDTVTFVPHDRENATYTIMPIPELPLPTLAVSPERFNASHVGQTFAVYIAIQGLNASWNMSGYTFNFTFNPSALQVISVGEEDFLGQFGDTAFESTFNNTSGTVWVNGTQLDTDRVDPFGDGNLARIVFNATTRPPAKSDFTISSDAKLSRWQIPDTNIPYQTIVQGKYEMYEVMSHTISWDTRSFMVVTRSNSTVSTDVIFNSQNKTVTFNVTGTIGTKGHCEVTIPKEMLSAGNSTAWRVKVGSAATAYKVFAENATHTVLSFQYTQSTKLVEIVGTSAISPSAFDWMLIAIIVVVIVVILIIAVWFVRFRKKK
jgi:hypothetical protein